MRGGRIEPPIFSGRGGKYGLSNRFAISCTFGHRHFRGRQLGFSSRTGRPRRFWRRSECRWKSRPGWRPNAGRRARAGRSRPRTGRTGAGRTVPKWPRAKRPGAIARAGGPRLGRIEPVVAKSEFQFEQQPADNRLDLDDQQLKPDNLAEKRFVANVRDQLDIESDAVWPKDRDRELERRRYGRREKRFNRQCDTDFQVAESWAARGRAESGKAGE